MVHPVTYVPQYPICPSKKLANLTVEVEIQRNNPPKKLGQQLVEGG